MRHQTARQCSSYRSYKRKTMLRVLICVSALAVPLSAAAFTGGQLNKLCTKTDVASRSACAPYIEGAADGGFHTNDALRGTPGPPAGQYFCPPPAAPSPQ